MAAPGISRQAASFPNKCFPSGNSHTADLQRPGRELAESHAGDKIAFEKDKRDMEALLYFLQLVLGRFPPKSPGSTPFQGRPCLVPSSNDDYPPEDVAAGQDLVLTIHPGSASQHGFRPRLSSGSPTTGRAVSSTTSQPRVPDDDPSFDRYGPRVPQGPAPTWAEGGDRQTASGRCSLAPYLAQITSTSVCR